VQKNRCLLHAPQTSGPRPLRPSAECILIWLAVSLEPQRPPQSVRRPGGRPRLAFEFLPRRSTWREAAGRFGHIVKCAHILRPVSCSPQPQPHGIRGPGGRPRLTFGLLRRWWEWLEPGLEQPGGRFGHVVKCARILRPVSCSPQPQPHFMRGPRGRHFYG
jgi:hypothetical protein